jgi:hypothetical protein
MMVTLLLDAKGLNATHWGLAFDHAIKLQNSLPIISQNILSPYEALYGVPSYVDHLRVFGCGCMYHLKKKDRGKLEFKADPAIYAGALSRSLAKLLDIKTNKVIIRRFDDIIFNKESFPETTNTKNQLTQPTEDGIPRYHVHTPCH